jgi:glycosyltransferase involved in cell wall biosynthesis
MRVGICHFRAGKTDGVSLETLKMRRVLREMGHEPILIAGSTHNGADYLIPELEFEQPRVARIRQAAFQSPRLYHSADSLQQAITEVALEIEQAFTKLQKAARLECLFLHNIFSHALHPPATLALSSWLQKRRLPAIGWHHDFYWDGPNAHIYRPRFSFVQQFLQQYLPPRLPGLQHVTINTINQEKLRRRFGLSSLLIPDTMDFDQPTWRRDNYNRGFLKEINVREDDLFILQATRLVRRKAIELAIELTAELTRHRKELIGKRIYNGKRLNARSRIILVFAGRAEIFSRPYRRELQQLIKKRGIEARFADHCVDIHRHKHNGHRFYSLWDTYVYADLVTYPSIWEGFGNQFLEAVFARKPVVLFEYPVFRRDIGPEGYFYVSFGHRYKLNKEGHVTIPPARMKRTVRATMRMLLSPQTAKLVERNFHIGCRNHDDSRLRRCLTRLLRKAHQYATSNNSTRQSR